MIRRILTLGTAPALTLAQPATAASRAEAMLDGPPAPYIDSGPANAKITPVGPVIIQLLPAYQVRRLCPAAVDWHSLACTLMPGRVILMPDEESSGLSTEQWLELLRHELLHAVGLDFHGARP